MTDAELRSHASPVVVEADDAIRSIFAHLNGEPLDVAGTVFQLFLMGAVGALKQAGQPKAVIAANMRMYADMLEKDDSN